MARDGTRSLAGGAVIETRLCARLLGLRLIVIDGAITVWPAPRPDPPFPVTPVSWTEVAEQPALGTSGSGEPAGGRLQATALRLDATADRLRRLTARPR
jgi:hypothetical protein